jgi:hypothetical protein
MQAQSPFDPTDFNFLPLKYFLPQALTTGPDRKLRCDRIGDAS